LCGEWGASALVGERVSVVGHSVEAGFALAIVGAAIEPLFGRGVGEAHRAEVVVIDARPVERAPAILFGPFVSFASADRHHLDCAAARIVTGIDARYLAIGNGIDPRLGRKILRAGMLAWFRFIRSIGHNLLLQAR